MGQAARVVMLRARPLPSPLPRPARERRFAIPQLVSGRVRLYLNVRRLRDMAVLQVCSETGEELEVLVAERFLDRLAGLAGLDTPPPAAGLLIPRCRSIHTFGMRFPIDVLFVTLRSGSIRVHDVHLAVPPSRLVRASPPARRLPGLGVLELAAGFRLRDSGRARRLEPEHPAHPLRQVPVPIADQLHRRGHEHRTDDRRVEQDAGPACHRPIYEPAGARL